jgi:hypothetical protein
VAQSASVGGVGTQTAVLLDTALDVLEAVAEDVVTDELVAVGEHNDTVVTDAHPVTSNSSIIKSTVKS